jgi:hypothetical protein
MSEFAEPASLVAAQREIGRFIDGAPGATVLTGSIAKDHCPSTDQRRR